MDLATKFQHTRELFPRIYDSIELLWGYPELHQYLEKLMLNDRTASRTGFPPEVAKELSEIRVVEQTEDIWALNYC